MTPRSLKWFKHANSLGVDPMISYLGAEVIDSWSNFWNFEIPDESLEGMAIFARDYPEAAKHRWSIMAGPRPYLPIDSELQELKKNPKYSAVDF